MGISGTYLPTSGSNLSRQGTDEGDKPRGFGFSLDLDLGLGLGFHFGFVASTEAKFQGLSYDGDKNVCVVWLKL